MLYKTEEPPITKGDDIKLKRRFISFYILKLSIGMPYYKGGHNKLAKVCNQMLNLTYILSCSAKTSSSTSFNSLLSGVVSQCHTWREALLQLNWPLGVGGYLYPSNGSSYSLIIQFDQSSSWLFLSLLHWWPSILERKGSKTRLESRSIDSQSLRALGSSFSW
jgi:hypothetical protein